MAEPSVPAPSPRHKRKHHEPADRAGAPWRPPGAAWESPGDCGTGQRSGVPFLGVLPSSSHLVQLWSPLCASARPPEAGTVVGGPPRPALVAANAEDAGLGPVLGTWPLRTLRGRNGDPRSRVTRTQGWGQLRAEDRAVLPEGVHGNQDHHGTGALLSGSQPLRRREFAPVGGRPGCWRGGIAAQSPMNCGPWWHGDELRHVAATALGLQWPQHKGLLPRGRRGAPEHGQGRRTAQNLPWVWTACGSHAPSRQSQVLWPAGPSRGGRSSGGHWALPAHTSQGSLHPHWAGQCGRLWSLSLVLGLGHRAQGWD